MIETATAPPPLRTARRPSAVLGAVVVGAVDGAVGVALPTVALAAIAVLAWAALGAPGGWPPFARGAAVVWWLGHGVDVRFAAAGGAFPVTAAAIGPALGTLACAVRAGRRAAGTGAPGAAWAAGVVLTAVAALGLLLLASTPVAAPVAWQAVLLPTALVAAGSVLALRGRRPLPAGVRAGVAAALLLLGASALLFAVAVLLRYAEVVRLYETLSPGPVGGAVLTLLQILLLPTLAVWTAGWASGASVGLGTGSASGVFGAQVGPMPALPVLAAVPGDPPPAAAAVLLLPVLAGFVAAAIARRTGASGNALALGLSTGATAGLVLGLLTAATAGSAGPGRFAAVGPDAVVVAALVGAIVAVSAALGAAVVRPHVRQPDGSEPAGLP